MFDGLKSNRCFCLLDEANKCVWFVWDEKVYAIKKDNSLLTFSDAKYRYGVYDNLTEAAFKSHVRTYGRTLEVEMSWSRRYAHLLNVMPDQFDIRVEGVVDTAESFRTKINLEVQTGKLGYIPAICSLLKPYMSSFEASAEQICELATQRLVSARGITNYQFSTIYTGANVKSGCSLRILAKIR